MKTQELREQRLALVNEAKALLPADNKITSEIRTQFESKMAEADNLAAVIASLENEDKAEQETRGQKMQLPNVGEHSNSEVEDRNKEIRNSFTNYLRTGKVETRDLTVAGNGVLVPQLFNPAIYEAKKSYGELYNLVSVLKTADGNPMKLVYDNDTSNSLVSVTSGTDASEVDPSTSSATLSTDNFTTGVVKVDMALLQDAGFDVDSWLKERFAQRFYRGISNLIYNGDASAVNSLSSAYTNSFTSATTNKLAYADFATAIATLDPAYQTNAAWGMSNATLGYVAGLADSNGRPLFVPFNAGINTGNGDNIVGSILGKPVKLITQMPTVATGNNALLFGDFKAAYTVRQVGDGLTILRLNERYAASFEVGFVGFARLGGVATNYGCSPLVACQIK